MNGIGLIYNPRSGKNKRNRGYQKEISNILKPTGIIRGPQTIEELNQALEEFKHEEIDILAISGGDGTVHLVLTTLVKIYGETPLPKILILRSGTMNTVTNSLKIKGKATDVLKNVLKRYHSGSPLNEIKQHLMMVNDRCGFMAGGGIVTNFVDRYYSSKKPGPAEGAKMVGHLIFSTIFKTAYAGEIFSPTPLQINIDGKDVAQTDFMYFMGCTITDIGLGFSAMHHAYDKQDHFHFQLSRMSPLDMLPKLPYLYAGKDFSHPDLLHHGSAKNVTITPKGEMKWLMDGDIYSATSPLHLSAGPMISIIS